MNRRISNQMSTLLFLTLALLIFCPVLEVSAQMKRKKGMGVESATSGREKKNVVPEFWISGTLTSPDGKAVGNALITADEGAVVLRSDEHGTFKLKGSSGSFVLIEATGFEPLVYEIKNEENDLALTLQTAPLYAGQLDVVDLPLGVQEKQRYLVGAVSGVSGDALTRYPEPLLANTLQGQLPGLYVDMVAGGLGNNAANLYIRGNHRYGGNQIIALVDGMERDIDNLLLEEIASVQIMKDPTSKILYGSRAANGILSVTTKRGKMYTRKVNVMAEGGVGVPVIYPKYLNSYEYAQLYNEARVNDGLPPVYSTADLQGYLNSKGPNDLRYPDVDYIDYFLSKTSGYRKVALEFSGGNENMQYALVAGYNGNTGLQKVGDAPTRDWYNVRGNLDMKITDYLKAFVGISGVYDATQRGPLNHSGVFNRIRDTRPNEFPLVIDEAYIPIDTLGYPALGASFTRDNNLYGELKYGGKYRENAVNGGLTLGLDFDLSSIVQGLSMRGQLGFDNYFMGQESVSIDVRTYAQRWAYNPILGADTVMFQQRSTTAITDQNKIDGSWNLRWTSYIFGMDYERTFNDAHRVSANLLYHYMMAEATGFSPNLQSANTALRVNYSFNDKYVAEVDVAMMGSDVFPEDNRYFMSYAGGLGWIVTEEDFLKGNKIFDYLKIKASGGLLGTDQNTPWNLHWTRWEDNGDRNGAGTGNYNYRANTGIARTSLVGWGNPNLKWEKSLEFNAGVEGLLLNRKLWVEANYFHETRSDIISNGISLFSQIYGGLYGWQNIGEICNQGFDFEAKYMNKAGDFLYSVGLSGTYSKNKIIVFNEVDHPLEYRRNAGKTTDAMFGYVAKGLYGKDVALSGAPRQTLGKYGEGDIAYEDLNDDGVIDENDQKMVGNNFPRVNMGLNIDFGYKGFAVNLLGVTRLGVNSWLNNEYYWNYGDNKWSNQTQNRYHPDNNREGTYPLLTTSQGANNFVNSTFWLANTSFFRLKNVEVSYTFGYNKPLTPSIKTVKVFARGTNLLTISKVKDLDPEALNAGVNNYPLFSTYTAGLSVVF